VADLPLFPLHLAPLSRLNEWIRHFLPFVCLPFLFRKVEEMDGTNNGMHNRVGHYGKRREASPLLRPLTLLVGVNLLHAAVRGAEVGHAGHAHEEAGIHHARLGLEPSVDRRPRIRKGRRGLQMDAITLDGSERRGITSVKNQSRMKFPLSVTNGPALALAMRSSARPP